MSEKRGGVEAAIEGTARGRFVLELCSNSAVFPVANILLEFLVEGGPRYFLEVDFYAILIAALVQAAWITRMPQVALHRFAGNLVGPALYTALELTVEGSRFLAAPHHVAYWLFSFAIGALQAARAGGGRLSDALLAAETVVRAMILFAMYAIFEELTSPAPRTRPFFADPSHVFIAWAIALLGLVAAIAAITAQRYLALLRDLSRRLRTYSEWLFGRALLEQAVADPSRLVLKRRERAVLFMDVRSFTPWSEREAPETVVALLNDYYTMSEAAFAAHPPIRSKFSADEVMAVFDDAATALRCAQALRDGVSPLLGPHGLAAGIGLHWGAVVEGLVGGRDSKSFDVIGDTVNTAKRIEGAAQGGEILFSAAFGAVAGIVPGPQREIELKGKSQPIAVQSAAPAPLTAIKPRSDLRAVT